MTSINFENSSVVLSWGALVESIMNRNIMQANFYSSVADSTSMALSLSKEQATQQKKEMNANADQTRLQALGSIAGGAASGLVSVGCGKMADLNYAKGGAPATTNEIGVGEASSAGASPNAAGSASIDGQNSSEAAQNAAPKTETPPRNQYTANGDWWSQNSYAFSNGSSSVLSGGFNMGTVGSIQEQGKAKAAQTIAAAVAQIENSIASTMTATQQGLDSANGSTNQTLSTMIGVCAAG